MSGIQEMYTGKMYTWRFVEVRLDKPMEIE